MKTLAALLSPRMYVSRVFRDLTSTLLHCSSIVVCSMSCLLITLLSANLLIAQNSQANAPSTKAPESSSADVEAMRVGPYCAVSAQINTATIPDGWKTAPRLISLPELGANLLIPIQSYSGMYASLDLGVHQSAVVSKPFVQPSDQNTLVFSAQYVDICPAFALSYGYFGLRIGIPIGASLQSLDGSIQQHSVATGAMKDGISSLVSQSSVIYELRLAGMLPLLEDAQGTLFVFATAGYQLNSLGRSDTTLNSLLYEAGKTKTVNDPRPAGLSVGLRYLFELGR